LIPEKERETEPDELMMSQPRFYLGLKLPCVVFFTYLQHQHLVVRSKDRQFRRVVSSAG
jgi:hypothetical protein